MKSLLFFLLYIVMFIYYSIVNLPDKIISHFYIDTQYPEWVEAIELKDINTRSNKYVLREKDNNIQLEILYEKDNSYGDLCNIVNAHNDFVEDNPDYFEPGTEISMFGAEYNRGYTLYQIRLFNRECDYCYLHEYEGLVYDTETEKIQFASVDLKNLPFNIFEMEEKFHVPIVILQYDNPTPPGKDSYKLLEKFEDPEQVVIDFTSYNGVNENYDPEQVAEEIRKYAPGVRVFDAQYDKYID